MESLLNSTHVIRSC